ncbi:MAG: FtsX-like permease family protein [Actinobacteria bacterium]|uniref:Cell division protein FtsX n=1 Tax=freshwater metagenome TaxID=449393 RepID=A0A6J7ICT2_9ZZZZ|nr:FtsX-like permease family protein [Actinomycetota bacterium]MSW40655.1 FtsX-like permease family protein [Actinomycetota bacterium]
MRAKFVLGEVGTGLRRNLTMTVAVIITVAVSLGLFGGGLLVRAQVDQMKDYWYDKVEVSLFLCGKVSEASSCSAGQITKAQTNQIKADLESLSPVVEQVYFESQAEAFARFQQQFKGSPLAENATVNQMPESFRVKLSDPTKYAVVASAFQGRPGVEDVRDQRQALDRLFKALGGLQALALTISIAMLIVTMLLIANTMRVAAFSRRRETGIMRLVGASNLYIQLPFLMEAATAASIGAGFAVLALVGVKKFLIDGVLAETFKFTSFVGWETVWTIAPVVFLTGIVLSALAAFLTLRKYLQV